MTKMKNSVNGLNRRLYKTEEKIIKIEYRSEEDMQNVAQEDREISIIAIMMRITNICITGVSEETMELSISSILKRY